MTIEPDSWLANIFRHNVFKVSSPLRWHEKEEGLSALAAVTHGQSTFFYSKIPVRRLDEVRFLARMGFYVVDTTITFEREPGLQETRTAIPVHIRESRGSEDVAILDIAASCFVYSRFHLDSQISHTIANKVKRAWVENYLDKKRGETLFISETAGKPSGFLAALGTRVAGQPVRVIDLVGVAQEYQGHGIGKALVQHFIRTAQRTYSSLRVGTQIANIPSVRLYESCGFQMVDSTYVLHMHMKNGKVLS